MRQTVFKYSGKLLESLALSTIVFFSSASHGVQPRDLNIAQTPLFLGFAVQPNVFFVTDDSGSMDMEFMTPSHWSLYNYDPDPERIGDFRNAVANDFVTSGALESVDFSGSTPSNDGSYAYIYHNRDSVLPIPSSFTGVGLEFCSQSRGFPRGRTEECTSSQYHPLDVEWRGRSNSLNKVFYNANILYEPWDGPCDAGVPCANALFDDARSNPYFSQDGFNVRRNLETDGNADNGPFIYEVWIDDSGYEVGQPSRPGDTTIYNKPARGSRFNETGYAASKFGTETGIGDAPNKEVDLWDSHMKFSVSSTSIEVSLIAYNPEPTGTARGLNETKLGGTTELTGTSCYRVLGNKGSVKTVRDAIISDPSQAATAIAATGTPSGLGGPECRTIKEATQNIANWYQYYRRRAYPVKNAIAEVMDAQPSFRFGLTVLTSIDPDVTYRDDNGNVIGDKGIFVPLPAIDEDLAIHNERVKEDYFSFVQPAQGTPLRTALERAGEYFKNGINLTGNNHPKPIIYPCQKNFTIMLTDGFWNTDDSFTLTPSDPDGDGVVNTTLADVAYKYYIEDLSPLPNDVPRDDQEDDLPAGGTDKTTIQHMVTFTVAFGVNGQLVDNDGNGNPDTDAEGNAWTEPTKNGKWGTPLAGQSKGGKIDDLWHAAYNSGGVFASAATPTEVTEKLLNAISAVSSRLGSASAVALNSGTLNANSRLYLARFNSEDWSGNVFSVPIQDGFVDIEPPIGVDDSPLECLGFAVGELCDSEWNAAFQLANRDYNGRKIFTMNTDSRALVAFDWDALSGEQQDALRVDPDAPPVVPPVLQPEDRGKDRLAYLKGDHSQEIGEGGNFRARGEVSNFEDTQKLNVKNRLGDIVHSSPAFVGAPNFFYPESIATESYAKFKLDNRQRTGMVYVGSNDGMLHGFNATTGDEAFAYIPGALVNSLNKLTAPSYDSQHKYYADGSPVVFDAFKGDWKTMLAAPLGAGHQGVFGLEITDPAAFGAGANSVAWEFTDDPLKKGDEDLGYITGDVSFAKMNDDSWAVIFGNGYNNTKDDDNKSATGNGVIYIVDAFSGELIKKIDTGIGWADDPTGTDVNGVLNSNERPNGIASVTAVDMDGDFKADYLYAGDLFGNLWKVDVTSASASSWKIAYAGQPFFVAKDATTAPPYPDGKVQPITSGVAVKRHPVNRGQVLVLFGTGKYIEINDAVSASEASDIETFYSIWDDGLGRAGRGELLKQEILGQVDVPQDGGGTAEFRITSSALENPGLYAIDWGPGKHRGWYMDLRLDSEAEYGEEVVVTPLVRNNRVVFITQTPNGAGTCSAGGTSWLMELNANDGSRLPDAPFDVNGNGIIDENDVASFGADKITSGVRLKKGISAGGGVLSSRNSSTERKYLSGSSSRVNDILESATAEYRKRQSWRQLR